MAVVFANNTYEIAVVQRQAGRPVVNVWHMHFDPELGSDTVEAVVRDFADNWQDHVTTIQSSAVEVLRFEYRSLDAGSGVVGTLDPDPAKPTVGDQGPDAAPPNVAYLVNKRTSDRPRGRRDGRMFLAGVREDIVDPAGVLGDTYVGPFQAQLDLFYDGISDSSGTGSGDRYPVVLETTAASRAPGSQPVTVNTRRVTSLQLDTLVSTQRDRLR